MNLLFTLFGGMLATAAVYGGLRSLRVGNFWAAVAASGGIGLVYIAYAAVARPGLDTVSIHLVAYPTVAVVLAQLYDTRKNQRLHWAPRLIVGLFLTVSVLFGGLAYISSHGLPQAVAQWFLPGAQGKSVHTGFAGVVEHDREAAKGIGQHLKAEHALASLGWEVEVEGVDRLSASRAAEVAIKLRDRTNRGVDPARVGLAFARPGQPAGAVSQLSRVGQGRYLAHVGPLEAGTWVAHLVIEAGTRTIAIERTIEVR
ncbi:MAG: FixH family protein [Betaproteobacteria bacterium]|nr:FixH family protein [Betaproteobacteria bacterium]